MAMRAELKRPLGHLFRGPPAETVQRLVELLEDRETPLFAVVGDFTSESILTSSLEPDIVVVDHRDIPGGNAVLLIEDDQPVLASDCVRHLHEPVVLLAHTSWGQLRRALQEVEVLVDPDPPALDFRVQPTPDQIQYGNDNVLKHLHTEKGEVERALELVLHPERPQVCWRWSKADPQTLNIRGSNGQWYRANGACECEDYQYRGGPCKHQIARWLIIRAEETLLVLADAN